ncbi:hypothetical protein [Pedobacter rhizosphaerae]|uniref:Uncharacterized protein n=1 Tax=Pedobacter rhizosphaerae TaxID=390241 RepID=A0A1H9T173_9SPHI|nr:hypothetical protein [Pedobacter rhizosphaerae]SER90817.1 hypothetical protein SAMN04488023_12038 [Pedobacter rhizosphaerae]
MRELEPPFELSLDDQLLSISEHELAGKRVFHVNFGTGEKPLVIAVGLGVRGEKFWTSIPEGRQAEAQRIGKLIAGYIRGKK